MTPSDPPMTPGKSGWTPVTDTLISDGTKHASITMTEEFSDIPVFMEQMAKSIKKTVAMLDKAETSAFFHRMLAARRIYVAGAGRSGLIARAFAMRLLHLGFDVYVVGETITPALQPGDTLVVFSGSGETHSMVTFSSTVKELGGCVCLITASPDSKMSRIAETVVNLGDLTGYYRGDTTTFEERQMTGQYRSVASVFAPLGTMFETLALIFSDAVISALMEAKKEGAGELKGRLANME
jgi:6-phospho-3-hexuloisomerase